MKKLTRIERNFIFENFVKDKPMLRFISQSGKIIKANSDQYQIDNNIIELSNETNIITECYTFLFPHKARLISSEVFIQKKQNSLVFTFPSELMLYENNSENNIDTKLILDINKKNENGKNEIVTKELNLKILDDFQIFNFENDLLNEQTNNNLLTNINLMLNYQNAKLKDDFCISRIYAFLQKLFAGNIKEFETSGTNLFICLVFISEKCAIIFMPAGVQKLVSLSIKKMIGLKIGKRFLQLNIEKVAGTINLKKSAQLHQDMALVAFSTENIAIEDKRFLHERIYNKKFGIL